MKLLSRFSLLASVLLLVRPTAAQAPRDARLLVTVVDQTAGVLPGATVTVMGLEDATRAAALAPATTSAQGLATLTGLRPGRYTIQAEFPGFETSVLKEVRLRTGDNRQVLTLAIQKLEDTITVGRDRQEAAADRQNSFGSALTREQLDTLSEDPDVLRQQLAELAGPGAVIRVDSFEGAPLPPKSQIKSIHVTRDGFAAENHNAGAFFVDIVTQPGIGPLRGQTFYRLRDGSLTGKSPFVTTKGPERLQQAGLNFGGALAKQRSSFSLQFGGTTAFETPNLHVALPGSTVSQALQLRTPTENKFVQGLFDYALTKDQTLRVSYNENDNGSDNLGIGAYDLSERAYSNRNWNRNFRIQEVGPIGRRLFINTRVNMNFTHIEQRSDLEAPTIHVNDAFTSGGAQVAGKRLTKYIDFASDLDYVRGVHSLRVGTDVIGSTAHSDLNSNYLGTYTFESLAAYQAGQPTSYTRRIGDPNVEAYHVMSAVYAQDDIRLRKNLTLSPGLRYEVQAHIRDYNNVGPRIGVTWAPFKSGKTTLRASAGIFYDWLNQNSLEQVIRVDGFHQQEANIFNPAYPDPGPIGAVLPSNQYQFDSGLQGARNMRLSSGFDQQLAPRVRMNVLYAYIRGENLWRGLNLNAPVAGVRPDPTRANIVDVVSDAGSRQHQLTIGWNIGLPPQPPFNQSPTRWDWKRNAVYGSYVVTRARNNTDGDFSLPPGSLADEWGRSFADTPYRLNVNVTSLSLRNLTATLSWNAQSGSPYTLRTGFDDNRDLVFNDRPAGVARNTLRAQAQMTLSGNFAYSIPIRKRTGALPSGIQVSSNNGAVSVNQFSDAARYRVTFIVQAQNLTNHANYTGYSGTLTSPFFGQPTSVAGTRRVDTGIQFNF
jgi:hypothetical protein